MVISQDGVVRAHLWSRRVDQIARYFSQNVPRQAGCRGQAPSSQPSPPEPRSERPRGELALVLGRFFSLELIAAAIRAAQETGLGGFSSLQEQSGKSQILSEKQALAFSQGPF